MGASLGGHNQFRVLFGGGSLTEMLGKRTHSLAGMEQYCVLVKWAQQLSVEKNYISGIISLMAKDRIHTKKASATQKILFSWILALLFLLGGQLDSQWASPVTGSIVGFPLKIRKIEL